MPDETQCDAIQVAFFFIIFSRFGKVTIEVSFKGREKSVWSITVRNASASIYLEGCFLAY